MEIIRTINGEEIKITLTQSELYDAKKEAELADIKNLILDRLSNYDPKDDIKINSCADEVHTSVYCDKYVWQEYDEYMSKEIDRCMKERGLK